MDIWLKSAKPSALLKDPLPKGSKVPKGPASITNRSRVTGHPRTCLLGSKGSVDSHYSTVQEIQEVTFVCWGHASGQDGA